jgi:hypothetical protein
MGFSIEDAECSSVKGLSDHVKQYVDSLTDPDRESRTMDLDAIRKHPWFESLDFAALEAETTKAPFLPNTQKANFETHDEDIMAALDGGTEEKRPPLSEEEEKKFAGWWWSHDPAAPKPETF